jgi:hypothetical protein
VLDPRLSRPWLALVLLLGCGDAQLGNSQAGVATTVSAIASCGDLAEGESLMGVSPDGEAWIEGDGGMRQVSPDGSSTPIDARFTRSDELVGWDASSAFVVGDNTLWSTTLDGSEPVSLPPELGKPRFVCGDPRTAGGSFLVSTRGLFERRDGTWLRWAIPVELLESMTIRDLQGACSGREPVMYIEAAQSLWEARYGDAASFRELGDVSEMTARGADVRIGFVAVRDGALVRFDGGAWIEIPFDEGTVTAMSVADGVLWAAVGAELYRRNRFEKWERLETATWPFPITRVESYAAGGAWLVKGAQLCHIAHPETIRVYGVRPYQRVGRESAMSLDVSGGSSPEATLSARLDGHSLAVGGVAGRWTVSGLNALQPGWHSLTLDITAPTERLRRVVDFMVEGAAGAPSQPSPDPTVYWEADIRPIYEARCAVCHGESGNQTFLGSYQAFSALGQRALELVSSGEMPPATSAVEALTSSEIGLLETWVQEGMNP